MITDDKIVMIKTLMRRAGDAIRAIYNTRDFKVDMKADNSPLTIADRESNDIICKGLEQFDPSIPVISEESRALPYEMSKAYKTLWLVDPLDGTKEFIKRNG